MQRVGRGEGVVADGRHARSLLSHRMMTVWAGGKEATSLPSFPATETKTIPPSQGPAGNL